MKKYVPRRRTVAIVQGDDLDKLADLQRQIALADREGGDQREGSDADLLREEYEQAKAEAAERAIAFDVSPMSRADFGALVLAHPAREEHDEDERSGFNSATLPLELVAASRPADDEDTIEERRAFLADLPAGEMDRLFEVAWLLNTGAAPDPKDLPSLRHSPSSTAT